MTFNGDRSLEIVSASAKQTQDLGARLGKLALSGDLFCLEGELGSGKTCFVQGLGRGLGIAESIHSPTFILANEHRGGRLVLFHLDVYRIRGADEAIGIGLEDYVSGEGVCVVEWAEKIRGALPPERMWIEFRHLDETSRRLRLKAEGTRYQSLLSELASQSTQA
ncbi:MAG: tRNA (adenosine(37)-N6)-threonylcarbamoyltransferase complex ATPase subunit type 1 TsaE [Chloroflexi bacterium]|nr:tRNA (adenosine(37)-N6)-threonylcarbamoyltransferase complex ATPase subunit type 1 TsaE [Chloroflexota bacterium]